VETLINTLMISYYLLTESGYITVYIDRLFIYGSCDSAYMYENEVFSYLFQELVGFIYHALCHSYLHSVATWRMLQYMCVNGLLICLA
jgi:hypothetical protein